MTTQMTLWEEAPAAPGSRATSSRTPAERHQLADPARQNERPETADDARRRSRLQQQRARLWTMGAQPLRRAP